MNSFAIQPESKKPTREEGLAIAAQRKAARGRRTGRIRKAVAVVAVSAFIGPFAFIYSQMAAGKDPALAATQAVASNASSSLSQRTSSAASTSSTTSGSTSSGSSSSPAAVTTQQS